VLKRDKIIVATCSTSPPLAYVHDSGNLVGFEIDMGTRSLGICWAIRTRWSSSSCSPTALPRGTGRQSRFRPLFRDDLSESTSANCVHPALSGHGQQCDRAQRCGGVKLVHELNDPK
jgi:hypothetical protein